MASQPALGDTPPPPPHPTFTPGGYLRRRRQMAGLTLQAAGQRFMHLPGSAEQLAAYLGDIERDAARATDGDLARLRSAFPFSPAVYLRLAARRPVDICGYCACTESDACFSETGPNCAWASPDLCTACLDNRVFPRWTAIGAGYARRTDGCSVSLDFAQGWRCYHHEHGFLRQPESEQTRAFPTLWAAIAILDLEFPHP